MTPLEQLELILERTQQRLREEYPFSHAIDHGVRSAALLRVFLEELKKFNIEHAKAPE